ncbi:hypothetical protein NDU88_000754 [Pleurodeles waltl]|uniref:Uncharacterized protein n=1 Tax=Pleurodeles waltl TaxID=8319 RepID=A0AAV7NI49_PLEWA|nr:hypothetical protein NDU88_000754 [Pleurodeles waltl]
MQCDHTDVHERRISRPDLNMASTRDSVGLVRRRGAEQLSAAAAAVDVPSLSLPESTVALPGGERATEPGGGRRHHVWAAENHLLRRELQAGAAAIGLRQHES